MKIKLTNTEQLIELLPSLSPVEVLGVARILGIDLTQKNEDKTEFRDSADILCDLIEKFNGIGRAQQRQLLKVIRDSISYTKEHPAPKPSDPKVKQITEKLGDEQ